VSRNGGVLSGSIEITFKREYFCFSTVINQRMKESRLEKKIRNLVFKHFALNLVAYGNILISLALNKLRIFLEIFISSFIPILGSFLKCSSLYATVYLNNLLDAQLMFI
jgi:hypothetical protein